MNKKTLAYILIGIGALAAILYFFLGKKTATVESGTTTDLTGATPDARGSLATPDDATYKQLLGLLPASDQGWVSDLAISAYNSGLDQNGNALPLINGLNTKTAALFQTYMQSAPNDSGKYKYTWGDTPNATLLWPDTTTKKYWTIWNAFRAKYNA